LTILPVHKGHEIRHTGLKVPTYHDNAIRVPIRHKGKYHHGLVVPNHLKQIDHDHKHAGIIRPEPKQMINEPNDLIEVTNKKTVELNMNHDPNVKSPVVPRIKKQIEVRNMITNEKLVPIGGKCFDAITGDKRTCVPGAICTTEVPDYNSICVAKH